jgi:hypothetical protein
MESRCKIIFNTIVSNIAVELNKAGFKQKDDRTVIKWEKDCLKRISFDYTKEPFVEDASVSITVASGFKTLTDFLRKCPGVYVGNPRQPAVMVTNIGELRPPYRYDQWKLSPLSNSAEISNEIMSELLEFGLPFLEKYSSMDEVLEALQSGVRYNLGLNDVFYVAGILYLKGESKEALRVVEVSVEHFKKRYSSSQSRRDFERLKERESFLSYLKSKSKLPNVSVIDSTSG